MDHTEPYRVALTDVFEGPMDLLVYLIKKNEVDIYDIPIALITDQYLGYIDLMKSLNIDLAGEFLVMAATLTQIKSKMLLPIHEGIDADAEDPRLAITRPLIEYLQLKSAAEELAARQLLGEHTFIRNPDKQEFLVDPDEELIKIGLFELIDAFKRILERVDSDQRVDLTADSISVRDRITQIIDILEEKGSVVFDELFDTDTTTADVIVTFLAVLEMVKVRLVRIVQHVGTGIIRLFYL
ncbi:Segregation and condensation protein A [Olavius algarvensis associated proteobacterium Delta 3]|nr:Segregation and condensation protein A [Olavius algarvensis associated proteobacterium Delta 3]CAB5131081.1 Segregation and condensation protein A [Olavius algarvensis associated proteobacterium Delta 3]